MTRTAKPERAQTPRKSPRQNNATGGMAGYGGALLEAMRDAGLPPDQALTILGEAAERTGSPISGRRQSTARDAYEKNFHLAQAILARDAPDLAANINANLRDLADANNSNEWNQMLGGLVGTLADRFGPSTDCKDRKAFDSAVSCLMLAIAAGFVPVGKRRSSALLLNEDADAIRESGAVSIADATRVLARRDGAAAGQLTGQQRDHYRKRATAAARHASIVLKDGRQAGANR